MKLSYFILLSTLIFTNCKSVKKDQLLEYLFEDELTKTIQTDSILSKHFVGFQLFNLTTDKKIISYNDKLLFTPASNIKLLTYLTCLNILGDSLSTFKYKSNQDTVFILPQGDPSFLNNDLDSNQVAFKFLKSQNKIIQVYNDPRHNINAFGAGWAWDDSHYSYQSPMSFFPIYGNRVKFSSGPDIYNINVIPKYFKPLTINSDSFDTFIKRNDYENIFYVNTRMIPKKYTIERPYINTSKLTSELLKDTLHQDVEVIEKVGIEHDDKEWINFKSIASNTLYKKILFESDNHVADQLLLMCSNSFLGYMDLEDIIEFSLDSILSISNKELRWVDGSGLSRYNLVSPEILTDVLIRIYNTVGLNTIKEFFPTGRNGDTLPSIFNSEKDWIYAKTGTLSKNFSISGFLITDKNQILAFSFMNNHYTSSKNEVANSMLKILMKIKKSY